MTSDGEQARSPAPSPARPVTLRDVAARANVDVSVVSRLVNGASELRISAATRARVEAALAEMQYRPNLAARALRTSRGRIVALLLQQGFANLLQARIATGVQRRAAEEGYLFVLGDLSQLERSEPPSALLGRYRQSGIEGVLVGASTLDDATIGRLLAEPLPVVFVNRVMSDVRCWAHLDDEAAARIAVDHLMELGHTRIGVVSGPPRFQSTARRLRAFQERAVGAGLRRLPTRAAPALSPTAGYRAARRLLADHAGVTAVVTTQVMLAVGAVKAAQDRSLAVPGDLSIVGLHDVDIAGYTSPPLTTVDMPMEELGAAAFDLLLAMVAGRDPAPAIVATPPRLVRRASTAPPPVRGRP